MVTCAVRLRGSRLVVFACACAWARPAASQPYEQARVKAEFFERFCRFVDWPATALAADAPFVVGILGDDAVAPLLEEQGRTRTLKDRRIEIRRLARPADAASCQAVWVAASSRADVPAVVRATRGLPVLTVGDGDGFARMGLLIGLRPDGEHFRFEVNWDKARRSGLQFSSKLLRLGTIVGSGEETVP
jgi:hypothetical protein